jgi:hypothetical protein
VLLIIGVVLAVSGIVGVYTCVRASDRAMSQTAWLKAPGSVIGAEVRYDGEMYYPSITYEYTYSSAKFTGTKFKSALLQYNWRGPSERVVQRFPKGASIEVYVNPDNPREAVLEPGGTAGYSFIIVIACISILAGAFTIIKGLW